MVSELLCLLGIVTWNIDSAKNLCRQIDHQRRGGVPGSELRRICAAASGGLQSPRTELISTPERVERTAGQGRGEQQNCRLNSPKHLSDLRTPFHCEIAELPRKLVFTIVLNITAKDQPARQFFVLERTNIERFVRLRLIVRSSFGSGYPVRLGIAEKLSSRSTGARTSSTRRVIVARMTVFDVLIRNVIPLR